MKEYKTSFGSFMLRAITVCLLSFVSQRAVAVEPEETIHPDTVIPESRVNDAPNWELGTIFRPSTPGTITQVRVFSLFEELGEHQVRIWRNSDDTLLAGPIAWTFGGEETWISLDIEDVPVQAGTDYTVSVSVGADGWYPANPAYFADPGNNGLHLSYPAGAGVFSEVAGNRPTTAFGNTSYLRDVLFEPDLGGPIIQVRGNNVEIGNGDPTASAADHTHFGGVTPGVGSSDRTFTINNAGAADLELTGNPKVVLAGPHAADFSVTTPPGDVVVPGASTTFTVQFEPSAAGVRDAIVLLTNSASAGAPFQFAIQGVGVGAGNLTLGSRSEGTSVATMNDGAITGNRYLALRNMRVTDINVKVRPFEGLMKAAVYSDADGAAERLLRATSDAASPAGGWQALPLTEPLELAAGSYYWLVIWSDTPGTRVYAESGGASQSGDYPYGDWPDPIDLTAAPGNVTYSIYTEGRPTDATGPEMSVKGSGNPITEGAADPSVFNGSDFGAVSVKNGVRETTFTIENVGTGDLSLTGSPRVVIAGDGAGAFSVTTEPNATVTAGGSTTFTVRFDPSSVGTASARVGIGHNGTSTTPFEYSIAGIGLGGGAGVLGSASEGTAARNIDNVAIHGNRFQAPVDMRITELRAKVLELEGTYKCAVYADTNGWADRLLRSTEDVVFATNGWNTFPLTAPLEVTGGEFYWLVIWSDAIGARVQLDPVGTAYYGEYNYFDYAGIWPDPIDLIESSESLDPPERTYCIYAEGTPLGAAPGPEIDIRGAGGKLIVTPDNTPSLLDGTDFGSLDVGSGAADRTFTIENTGDAALELSPSIEITGPNAADFTVTAPPPASIPPGGNATFTLRFDPSVRGLRAATVRVPSNDAGETPAVFAVQGAGFTTGRESIWPETKTANAWVENTPYELGMIFQSSVAGKITHLRVYAVEGEAGDHIGRLWRNFDETIIGGPYTWNYGNATGWITFDIPDVDIDPDTEYTVAISTGNVARNYPNIAADLASAGDNGQHLSYPASAGVFSTTLEARPVSSFNGGNYLRDIIFVPAGVTLDLPDMDVRGNGTSIADGDPSPSAADRTDFGQAASNGGTVERTFAIFNTGTAPLNLTASPAVSVSGAHASEFTVIAEPSSPIAPGANATFTIRFAPAAAGARAAVVAIPNDSDKHPYDFAVAGEGIEAAAQLQITEVTIDTATAGVTLRWEGDGQQFQVEKAPDVSGPFQAVGAPQSGRTFTDPSAVTGSARMFYRIRQL